MFFWILLFLGLVAYPVATAALIVAQVKGDKYSDWGFGHMILVFPALMTFMAIASSWSEHASDLSRVEAQHHRIAVYEERVESLQDRLNNAQYPEKPGISLDSDTPWATMMQSLDNAETELAKAKDQRAIAIRSISARKRGPMSGVVTLVGDIDPAMLQSEL